ncbi:MAG TPA: hypothetical protein VGC06_24000 [Actinomycetes bacterium]
MLGMIVPPIPSRTTGTTRPATGRGVRADLGVGEDDADPDHRRFSCSDALNLSLPGSGRAQRDSAAGRLPLRRDTGLRFAVTPPKRGFADAGHGR